MARNEVVIILVLLVLIVLLMAVVEFFKENKDSADAKTFILEDLKQKYPGSDIEIITTKEKFNQNNERYYEIKAKVTINQSMPCPQRIHIYYNYPEQNFVPQTPEYITPNCEVCKTQSCNLIFPEEAIIASHTLSGTKDVQTYIKFYKNASATVIENATTWTVVWDDNSSSYGYIVKILKNGSVINAQKFSH